jgi:hypothetical protein
MSNKKLKPSTGVSQHVYSLNRLSFQMSTESSFFPTSAEEEYAGIALAASAVADEECAREIASGRIWVEKKVYLDYPAFLQDLYDDSDDDEHADYWDDCGKFWDTYMYMIFPEDLVQTNTGTRIYIHPRFQPMDRRVRYPHSFKKGRYCAKLPPLPKGAVYRTADELGIDYDLAEREAWHTGLSMCECYPICLGKRCCISFDQDFIAKGIEAKEEIARILSIPVRRRHALAVFARFN